MVEESRTELGTIKIHSNVISSIAAIAALEIEGVKRIGGDLRSEALEFLKRKPYSAIRVKIDKNEDVRVIIPLVIEFGYNIPEVATKVQENIRSALDKMTAVALKDIVINVQGIERG